MSSSVLSNAKSLSECVVGRRPRSPALTGRPAVWRTATLAGCVLAVVVAARVGHPAAYLEADPALAQLLRGMALIKACIVVGSVGAVLWRCGWALSAPAGAGFVLGSSVLAGSTMLIWQLCCIPLAAVAFHAALIGMLLLGRR